MSHPLETPSAVRARAAASLEGPFGSLTATAADLLRIAEAAKREAMGDG